MKYRYMAMRWIFSTQYSSLIWLLVLHSFLEKFSIENFRLTKMVVGSHSLFPFRNKKWKNLANFPSGAKSALWRYCPLIVKMFSFFFQSDTFLNVRSCEFDHKSFSALFIVVPNRTPTMIIFEVEKLLSVCCQ